MFADVAFDGIILVLREEALEPGEAAALGDGGLDVLRRLPEERREIRCDGVRVFLRGLARVDEERFRHGADGELAAVAVEDGAARRLTLVLLPHERLHARRKLVTLHELHVAIAHDDDADEHEHPRKHAHDAPLDLVLSLPVFLQNKTSFHICRYHCAGMPPPQVYSTGPL